jgi:putative ABC transport system permease protein
VVGVLLMVAGVYGVVAYWVRRREREFGIRLALGAPRRNVLAAVVSQGAMCAAIGIGIALPAAFGLSGFMSSVLYGISARDPMTFTVLPLVVLGVTLAASYFPARRAARVDPARAMRAE